MGVESKSTVTPPAEPDNASACANPTKSPFITHIHVNVALILLSAVAMATRFWQLSQPASIVFDELHFGKFAALYMNRTFFFDYHPPLGKQLLALGAWLGNFDGNFKFERIGQSYASTVPIWHMRLIPALCGSLIVPVAYQTVVELGFSHYAATLTGFLIVFDGALLVQSRFMLLEPMHVLFAMSGLLAVLRLQRLQYRPFSVQWWFCHSVLGVSVILALCIGNYIIVCQICITGGPYFCTFSDSMVVDQTPQPLKHGDVVELVHGMTNHALNSHNVAAPLTPSSQEVTCYIDHNVSSPAHTLWRIDILNRKTDDDVWISVQSHVRLQHVDSSLALKISGKQLPDWGFHQFEVVTDNEFSHEMTAWNVEEHRYTKVEGKQQREHDLTSAEMIPTHPIKLGFWRKFAELQEKMLMTRIDRPLEHMYSSRPLEWPLLGRTTAYWVSSESNAQIHLLGNFVIWYSGVAAGLAYCGLLVFYLIRRQRQCYDIDEGTWNKFRGIGEVLLGGYALNYVTYFLTDATLFLYHYIPALVFKFMLLATMVEHVYMLIGSCKGNCRLLQLIFRCLILMWLAYILIIYIRYASLCYGDKAHTDEELRRLKLKDTWDFILHERNCLVP
ncbi:PREDICTED: protein O-mannosyltransferase 1-like [Priapulus caudatus]|uniref:dolichyl-phosphate-mannose--protein mannosyltransferase n=1 Tax=Priapulus caudatus TaxID=37621 RepID=A0ABM1EKY4_PRICU|nr:PREDICTED: protein O-mannosyltransferase 1-like [Priapulus caudatus]